MAGADAAPGGAQVLLQEQAVILRGPGIRGLMAAGTRSGRLALLDPRSKFKVRCTSPLQAVGEVLLPRGRSDK